MEGEGGICLSVTGLALVGSVLLFSVDEEGGGVYEGRLLVGGEEAVVWLFVWTGEVTRLGIELGGVA